MPDGSYRRNRIEETPRSPVLPPVRPKPVPPKDPPRHEPPEPPCNDLSPEPRHEEPQSDSPGGSIPVSKPPSDGGIGSFFRRLLPKNLETADLLVLVLLFLMAGEKEEDRNNALLTMALYFFM